MFIKVGGPNGSGKTTVTTQLEELGRSFGLSIERVKGGDILLALANVATYDELRRIPEEVRAGLRPEMYRIMYEMDRNDPGTIRVRDAHFTLFDECTSRFVEGELQNGDKEVEIEGERVKVRAEVREINGFSSHKDSDHLLDFVSETAPSLEKVFVVMGEPKSAMFLVQKLRDNLGIYAAAPERGTSAILEC